MTNDQVLLACDAGQSSTRIRSEQDGWIETLEGVHTDHPLGPQLAALVSRVVERHPDLGTRGFDVALGSSGATDDEDAEGPAAALRPLGLGRLLLAHDSTTSYLGALGERPGVVTAAGTGVITLAVGRQEVARVDGWGWIIGDEGSAFWLGRAGLRAVLRAHDGRGPATALTGSIGADFDDIEAAYLVIQADPLKVSRLAGYAALVTTAADAGDEVARRICLDAAHELAHTTATGLRRVGLGPEDEPPVALLGGVMGSELIRTAIGEDLARLAPGARIVEPLGTGLDGAAALATVDPSSPLGRRIAIA